jgi:hypothetical protein
MISRCWTSCASGGASTRSSSSSSSTEVPLDVLNETRKFLMKELGQRKLDETPAALANAAGTLAAELVKKAETIELWSETAGRHALRRRTRTGVLAWQQVLELQEPSERVLKIHATRPVLSAGHKEIRHLTEFIAKYRDQFREMTQFIHQLAAHRGPHPTRPRPAAVPRRARRGGRPRCPDGRGYVEADRRPLRPGAQ